MKKGVISTILTIITFSLVAQDFFIPIITDSIVENADAVVLYDKLDVELISRQKMTIHRNTAIKIFNNDADYLSNIKINYNKSQRIQKIKIDFFDSNNNKISSIKKNKMNNQAVVDGFSLYTDERLLYYNFVPKEYPYTVRFEYEIQTSNTAIIPTWYPIKNYNIGVIRSEYSFRYPDDFQIQKKEKNFDAYKVEKYIDKQLVSYKISHIPPIEKEPYSPSFVELVPHVKIGINKFHLSGIDGDAETWEEFGKWIYEKFLKPRNNLSAETVSKIRGMTENIEDPTERAKVIYDYVQKKTRYINVAIGIGGWRPMMTGEVDMLGYGDCKALTFYTKSLMDIAEVPAIFSIVHAGKAKNDIDRDIVSMQGNHAILCLPREKDSIWLECTNQKMAFGTKSTFTDDRDVLAITPQGGKIVHTSTNTAEENLQEISGEFFIDENGSIRGKATIKSFGSQYENHLSLFEGLSSRNLERRMKNYLSDINNIHFISLNTTNNKNEKYYEIEIEFEAEQYGIKNPDDSILFLINILNRNSFIPPKIRARKNPFKILRGYKDTDTYIIHFPDIYSLSQIPDSSILDTPYGTYRRSVKKLSSNSMKYQRNIILNKGTYDKNLYEDFRQFFIEIHKLDNTKMNLTKKEK